MVFGKDSLTVAFFSAFAAFFVFMDFRKFFFFNPQTTRFLLN